jgi:PPOX class probable F420-dependent enzyme
MPAGSGQDRGGSSSSIASQLSGYKYINLETYRRSGEPVVTPVWFTTDASKIFVVTRSQTGKVRRIKNNQKVRVMPSGMRGEPKGEWFEGAARIATPEELKLALEQRNKKYGFRAKLAGIFSGSKGELVGISISFD